MNLQMDLKIANGYKSPSQIARILTENWILNNCYCPSCFSNLYQAASNSKVRDFDCPKCKNQFELKSKKGNQTNKVTDGSYNAMMTRIIEPISPHFFFLNYDKAFQIENLTAVPNYFFQTHVIEKRRPLSVTAKRAGWIGCNILLDQIPEIGKIKLVKNGLVIDPKMVQKIWQKTAFLSQQSKIKNRGWTLDIMKCIELLELKSFNLQQLYQFELYLSERHPDNLHVKDKIRQQLQILRDKGYLDFTKPGHYKLAES